MIDMICHAQLSPEKDKKYGPFRPISTDVGDTAWAITYKPPAYGGKSEVKNFQDRSHLKVGGI